MRDLTFYRKYAPSSRPCLLCWHKTDRSWFDTDLPSLLSSLQKLDGQDRLTEVGHSIDGGVFRGFVLSVCCSIDTTREHACNRRQIPSLFCGCWLRSGIATPPRRPWTWQCRSCYFGSMAMVGGEFNVSISCSEFSGGRGAVLLRQLCLGDDCYSFWFSIWFCFSNSRHFLFRGRASVF